MDLDYLLKKALENINIEYEKETLEKFEVYYNMVMEWNEKINLTAICKKEDFYKKHFIDSLKLFSFEPMKKAKKLMDVGTGAGFPGIPIKLVYDKIDVTLLDSLNKRVIFLKEVIKVLDLKGINAIHGRAEDYAKEKQYREAYDIAVSRAVAPLPLLSEISLGFVKLGGYFIAMKGPQIDSELSVSERVITLMGGKLDKVMETEIEEADFKHNLVIVSKIKRTPKDLPRKPGLSSKNSL